jgi:uncharacterized damage-inducible protein DinB
MTETPEQYIKRILGNLDERDPLAVQAATAGAIEELTEKAPPEKLLERPAPGKWSVGEILAHLADAEIVLGWRVRSILGASGTTLQAFDQDAWARSGRYRERDSNKSLALFRTLREANLDLYSSLSPEQWEHYGMHAERGKETVKHIVRLMAGHDLNHLKQIQRILGAGGATGAAAG